MYIYVSCSATAFRSRSYVYVFRTRYVLCRSSTLVLLDSRRHFVRSFVRSIFGVFPRVSTDASFHRIHLDQPFLYESVVGTFRPEYVVLTAVSQPLTRSTLSFMLAVC